MLSIMINFKIISIKFISDYKIITYSYFILLKNVVIEMIYKLLEYEFGFYN